MPRLPYQSRLGKYYQEHPRQDEKDYLLDGSKVVLHGQRVAMKNRLESILRSLAPDVREKAMQIAKGAAGFGGCSMSDARNAAHRQVSSPHLESHNATMKNFENEFEYRNREIERN